MVRGRVIKARRQALGRSLQAVAQATRIPLAHLEALEEERTDELPAGPYALAYTRAVCAHLGLDTSSSEDPAPLPATPPQGAPLWMVRAMAGTSVIALVFVLLSLAWERVQPSLPALPMTTGSDQELVIVAREPTGLAVRVDGEEVLDRELVDGEKLSFAGRGLIEIEVSAISHLRLEWNGVVVAPQGRQDVPRTLRFVDDRVAW